MLDVALGALGVIAVVVAYGVFEGLLDGVLTETKWGRRIVVAGALVGATMLLVLAVRLLL